MTQAAPAEPNKQRGTDVLENNGVATVIVMLVVTVTGIIMGVIDVMLGTNEPNNVLHTPYAPLMLQDLSGVSQTELQQYESTQKPELHCTFSVQGDAFIFFLAQ